jgi:hypothetical protein
MIGPNALPIFSVPRGCAANDVRLNRRRHHVQAFQRRQHRYGRRHRAIAIDERRAEQAGRDDRGPVLFLDADQRHQRQNAALAVIVDAHRDRNVFDRRDDHQRPDQQAEHAQDGRRIRAAAGQIEHGLQRIERTRPDIPKHDPQRGEPHGGEARFRPSVDGRSPGVIL